MSSKLSQKKLSVLGAGKLGGILLRAYLKQGLFKASNVTASVKHEEKAAALAKELGVEATIDNRKAVEDADIILLGVRPNTVCCCFLAISGVRLWMCFLSSSPR